MKKAKKITPRLPKNCLLKQIGKSRDSSDHWECLRRVFLLDSLNNSAHRIEIEKGRWIIIFPSPSQKEDGFMEMMLQDRDLEWHEIPYGREDDFVVLLRRKEEIVYATWYNFNLHGVQRKSFLKALKAARGWFNKVEYHGLDEADYLKQLTSEFNEFLRRPLDDLSEWRR